MAWHEITATRQSAYDARRAKDRANHNQNKCESQHSDPGALYGRLELLSMFMQVLINRHQKIEQQALHADFLLLCRTIDLPCNLNLVNGPVCITMLPPFDHVVVTAS